MNNDIITLDVGGKIFKTTKKTLTGAEYFENLFSVFPNIDTSQEPLFIDRSYKGFEHVLGLLRNDKYEFPDEYKGELKYFGIKCHISDMKFIKLIFNDNTSLTISKYLLIEYLFFKQLLEKYGENDDGISMDSGKEYFSKIYDAMNGYSVILSECEKENISTDLKKYKLSQYFTISTITRNGKADKYANPAMFQSIVENEVVYKLKKNK